MPRIVAGSKASPWVPSADARATRVSRRDHQTARRQAERAANARAAAMRVGIAVRVTWNVLDGPPIVVRGVLVQCVPWVVDPCVLIATVRADDGTIMRVDATRVRRARG